LTAILLGPPALFLDHSAVRPAIRRIPSCQKGEIAVNQILDFENGKSQRKIDPPQFALNFHRMSHMFRALFITPNPLLLENSPPPTLRLSLCGSLKPKNRRSRAKRRRQKTAQLNRVENIDALQVTLPLPELIIKIPLDLHHFEALLHSRLFIELFSSRDGMASLCIFRFERTAVAVRL